MERPLIKSVDSYNASLTRVEFPWPQGITPLERIMLTSQGHLQRLLSAFFDRPILIKPTFKTTLPSSLSEALKATPEKPTTQKRQVHLMCAGRTVCVATSAVTITNARYAQLFLEEGYAIGQIFRKTGAVPDFALLSAGLVTEDLNEGDLELIFAGQPKTEDEVARGSSASASDGSGASEKRAKTKLWRRYTLSVEGFACDIVEVFPDRSMFTRAEAWLLEEPISEQAQFPAER